MELKAASDTSALIQRKMSEIRKKLEPVESVMCRLNGYIIQASEESHLKKVHMKCTRWTRGRCYNIQEGTLLLTPTNLTNLSYLDLEEYSIDCKDFLEQQQLSRLLIGMPLNELQDDVECPDFRTRFSDIFNGITKRYWQHVVDHLSMEMSLMNKISLLQKWESRKFGIPVFPKRAKISNEYFGDIHFCLQSRILIEHDDYKNIIDFLTFYSRKKIMRKLPEDHLHFYLMHIAHRLRSHPDKDAFKTNLGSLDWVEYTFLHGDTSKLRSLLAFGWPTFFFSPPDEGCGRLKWLPPMGDDKTSFMSLSFSNPFIIKIFYYTHKSQAPTMDKTSCIQLLWRAIPTPFVSRNAMKEYIEKRVNELSSMSPGDNFNKIWQAFEESFLDVYPEDCIADYQPRSLMHLCRCQIRQSLVLPAFFVKLPLPNRLIRYLNLKW